MEQLHGNLMIQGTASSAGKSILVTGLGRLLSRRGHKTAPFKSQNMSLNSFITEEGLEMGRAQVVQAEACGLPPLVCMNPILLKPTTDRQAQVILKGRVHKNLSAAEYQLFKPRLKELIKEEYRKLEEMASVILLEGAGSPAEINLKEDDVVNMGMADLVDAPVILVGDIDRGGVFASIYGTIALLTPEERKRIKGVVINKFRGDLEILKPGIKMLEDLIKLPVLGVVPWFDLAIEDEDSLTETFKRRSGGAIRIDVIRLPHISNFTDFNVFKLFDHVDLRYVTSASEIEDPHILIIPGSKNTIEDLEFIKKEKIDKQIGRLKDEGRLIIGICGGYQILGRRIEDPDAVETEKKSAAGIGLLDVVTTLKKEKETCQVLTESIELPGIWKTMGGRKIEGYEIHMGETEGAGELFFKKGSCGRVKENVLGTYIHGIFDNIEFTRALLEATGFGAPGSRLSYRDFKESQYDRLADILEESLDMTRIYSIIGK